ncbi:MAG: hypothetical protein K6F59_01815 [Gammaproteobacteria bacterium]|nr:hypothetical protein [Gammaproteobacteria bacterium]
MKKHLTNILLLLIITFSLVVASYSWMQLDESIDTNRYMELDLSNSNEYSQRIESFDALSMALYIKNGENYDDTDDSQNWAEPSNPHSFMEISEFLPGDRIEYLFEVSNTSDSTQRLRLSLRDIESSFSSLDPEILSIFSYLTLNVQRVKIVDAQSNETTISKDLPVFTLQEGMDLTGTDDVVIYDDFTIESGSTYHIYFDIVFSEDATYEYSDQSIKISKIILSLL